MLMMGSSSSSTMRIFSMRRAFLLDCLLLLIFISSNDHSGFVNGQQQQIPINDDDDDDSNPPLSSPPLQSNDCTLYLAESSIPNAGLGVYAGKDYKLGDTIGNPTVGIPLIDLNINRTNEEEIKKYGSLPEFLWETQNIGGYGEALHVDLFIPGIASLINHHSALDNVIASGLTLDSNLLRGTNPMAGSFSAYHKFTFVAKRDIIKGEELFVDKTSPNESIIQHPILSPKMIGSTSMMFQPNTPHHVIFNPTANDYIEADHIVNSLLLEESNLLVKDDENHQSSSSSSSLLTEAQWIDILYRLKTEILTSFLHDDQQVKLHHRQQISSIENVAHILPSSFDEIIEYQKLALGSSSIGGDGFSTTAKLPLKQRTIDWIQKNGKCLDGITEGTSTIKDAGRGAFATKKFVKGSTVSITPLMQIADKTVLDIKNHVVRDDNDDDDDDGGNDANNNNSNSTKQLLYNYCFGHRKSSLLLCPTTHAALINHPGNDGNSDSSNNEKKEANVAIRWVRRENLFGNEDLTVGPLDGLDVNTTELDSYNTKLFFEYVAIKDIEQGDELFLDYGLEYENALSDHLEHGTSSSSIDGDNNQYVSASSLMKDKQFNMKLPILMNQDSDNLLNRTHMYECEIYPNQKILPNPEWEDLASNRNVDKQNWPEEFVAWYKNNHFASWYPCMVVKSDNRNDLHDIELFVKPVTTKSKVIGRMFRQVPGYRIRVVDGYYQSDQHLPWAFRQYIPIPDSIFPLRWRDDYQTASSLNLGRKSELTGNAELQKEYEKSLRSVKCGLYLAKSNIPNAGFGIYTAVDIPASNIGIGTDITVIPILNLDDRLQHKSVMDYVWSSSSFGTGSDLGMRHTSFLAGMIGAMCNAHAGITNIKMASKSKRIHQVLDRSSDPGAGAISPYPELLFDSHYPINAGEELFVSYGENWFRRREQFKDVPLSQNFMESDSILASIWAMSSLEGAQIQPDAVRDLLRVVSEEIVTADHLRTRTALRAVKTFDDLSHVVARNGTAPATVEARSSEWLEENGLCLDHIYVKRSTIHQAGFGAFSRRALKKGTIISSAPMISHTRDDMLTYNATDLKGKGKDIHETQLMLNYHFGHENSSLLFFPLTQALDINHNSNRKFSGQEPNARVEFSTTNPKSRYFIGRTLEDIKKEKYSAVVLDFIATRDIEPDEEIFIDYGKEWEDAWDKHVEEWSSPCSSSFWGGTCTKSSKAVTAMNDDKFNKAYHEWSEDHFAVCQIDKSTFDDTKNMIVLVESAPKDFNNAMTSRESYKGIGYKHEGFDLVSQMALFGTNKRPCVIMSSSTSSDEFNVVAFTIIGGKRILIKEEKQPSKNLGFLMKEFKSDIFVPGTFRHEIMIPDESFPSLWKDLE